RVTLHVTVAKRTTTR
ncbi:periplasmic oligopeptide-binding protein, partial [Vibrio parahaemolyticus VP2007-007]